MRTFAFSDSVGQKLQDLASKICTHKNAYPGDVAAGSRDVRYDPSEDRIASPADDWNCASFGLKRENNLVRDCKDDIGSCGDDFVDNRRNTIIAPLGGVPVHGQIYTLDIAETFDFFEDDRVVGVTPRYSSPQPWSSDEPWLGASSSPVAAPARQAAMQPRLR